MPVQKKRERERQRKKERKKEKKRKEKKEEGLKYKKFVNVDAEIDMLGKVWGRERGQGVGVGLGARNVTSGMNRTTL